MTKKNSLGQVRIISGQWRGRKIAVPDLPGLRPTTDAVRETLFNWLTPIIHDANCLDLFAGSGALGFEALSRGAKKVTFADSSIDVIQHLRQTSQLLNANTSLLQLDASKAFTCDTAPFDIIFMDPPFHQGLLAPTLQWLINSSFITKDTHFYIEAESPLSSLLTLDAWHVLREKRLGQVYYYLLRRNIS